MLLRLTCVSYSLNAFLTSALRRRLIKTMIAFSTSALRRRLIKPTFESFLRWGATSSFDDLKAEREAGFDTIQKHPKCSPDLNAIEGWWGQLLERLILTAPTGLETRAAFVERLRRTVTWMNNNLRAQGRLLCNNQKARARAVKKLKGARCKW